MNNENKALELLEMMYQEMKEGFNEIRNEMNEGFKKLDDKIDTVDAKVDRTNIIIEHEITPKLEALFDGYNQHTEQINHIDTKIDVMQADIDHLTIKTLAQSDKIVDLSKRVK